MFVCLLVVVVKHPASSSVLFPDCLKVVIFTFLPLSVAFDDQQEIPGAYSSDGGQASHSGNSEIHYFMQLLTASLNKRLISASFK